MCEIPLNRQKYGINLAGRCRVSKVVPRGFSLEETRSLTLGPRQSRAIAATRRAKHNHRTIAGLSQATSRSFDRDL
jgi:hypothetical protein